MVFLHNKVPSRKRPSSSSSTVPPFPPPKIPKATTPTPAPPTFDKMVSILAEAGCTLLNPAGPPCLPSQPHKFRSHLHRLFSSPDVRSDFLSAFSSYIYSPHHLRRSLPFSFFIFSLFSFFLTKFRNIIIGLISSLHEHNLWLTFNFLVLELRIIVK